MSLKYDLFLKEATADFEFIERFLEEKNIPYSKKRNDAVTCFDVYKELGFEIYIFKESTRFFDYKVNNNTYLEYEWEHCTCISFEVDKFFDHRSVKSNLLEISIAYLNLNLCDAVLLFNGDVLILDRKNGVVKANPESGFWKSEELLIQLDKEDFKKNDFVKELYQQFEGQPRFDFYFRFINPDQDGSYNVFGAFGELLRDILIGKIADNELFLKLCAFIDRIIATKDPEWINVMRSEVFSILNRTELIKLQSFLSEESGKEPELFL